VFTPAVARSATPSALLEVPNVPAGLPSDMLERRPDIRQIEKSLAAASLRIDRARADYFPSVSLSGALGTESSTLSNLFSGPALFWSLGAGLLQPLLNLNTIDANV
jgi:multidrug efflux system outer membrane protein